MNLERYTQEEHPICERPSFRDTESYWRDSYLKWLKDEYEKLERLPGNWVVIDRIKQMKQILYQWFLIDPEELWFCKPKKKEIKQLEFAF